MRSPRLLVPLLIVELIVAGTSGSAGAAQRITEYPIPKSPEANPLPFEIAAGSDGNLWFTEYAANKIGALCPLQRPCR